MGIGSAIGGFVSGGNNMINSFLHPEKGYKEAQVPLQQGWNQAQAFQQPYNQQGLGQTGRLNTAENSLLDPTQLENQWTQSYSTSPYAQQLLKQNQANGLDAASQMGLLGSSAALGNIQAGAGNIVDQDRQQFLNDLMQKYLQGIGIGQNIYGVGATTAGNLGTQANTFGQNMAGLKYGETNAPGEQFNNLLKTGVQAAGNFFGGA